MGTTTSESVRDLISSSPYKKIVGDLKKELKLKVSEDYADIFNRLDTDALNRSGLELTAIEKIISERAGELKSYSIKKYKIMNGIQEDQEYPSGEEPEVMDRDSNIVSKGYAPGFLLANAIEYLLDEKSKKDLEDYLKASRIPAAKSYAKQIATFKL
ncbi:hypothetical protein CCL15_27825 [Pseudomonas syringae]|jgi:hypothetical protein|uniref:hypothetical protein n=1 Tax=Pseudomonas syringae TaxID=317 RepID=UPI000BB5BBF0|nr:hypothetical protein [Pseudomonas syringae]PBP61955.1 hypothetical protein CCL15_27825 [Pseudomonas syringae]